MRWLVLVFIVGFFLLWGYFSNWDLYDMIYHEGSAPNDWQSFPWSIRYAPYARVGLGFVLFIIGVLSIATWEHK